MTPVRRTHTFRNECRDFVEWHRGRSPYVLWAIDVDLPRVRERVAEAAGAMQDLLIDGYTRQPHVTLALCGFPANGARADDEFSDQCLAQQIDAMREAMCVGAGARGPFELHVGGLATFDSAPYLAVDDVQDGVGAIRRALTSAQAARQRSSGSADDELPHAYVPHVTIGLYRDAWPLAAVHERIAGFAFRAPLVVDIERVSLLAYDPREIGGALTTLGEFCLASGIYRSLAGFLPGDASSVILCAAQIS